MLHAVCDEIGRPVILLLAEGQLNDHKGAALIVHALPDADVLMADKAHHSDAFREAFKGREIEPCIAPCANRNNPASYCQKTLKLRHKVEAMFAKLKNWRRISSPYNRCAHPVKSAICISASVTFSINQ